MSPEPYIPPSLLDDLGLDVATASTWFIQEHETPYIHIHVNGSLENEWIDTFGVAVRRCYITDEQFRTRIEQGVPESDVLSATLPDPGSTMSGDFGEIVTYVYHATMVYPDFAFGPKKWRLKIDRTKSMPFSDVVQFVLPEWPGTSEKDVLICSEVKTQATAGNTVEVVKRALDGCNVDYTSRLTRTLNWIKALAYRGFLDDTYLHLVDRFGSQSTEHPHCEKRFNAVIVLCSTLVNDELHAALASSGEKCTMIVIVIHDLRKTYMAVFDAARRNNVNTSNDSGRDH